MIYRVTCMLEAGYDFNEVRERLAPTSYISYRFGRLIFAVYDFTPNHLVDERWKQEKLTQVEDDLMNLGIGVEDLYIGEIV